MGLCRRRGLVDRGLGLFGSFGRFGARAGNSFRKALNLQGVGELERWIRDVRLGFDVLDDAIGLGIFELLIGAIEAAFEAHVVTGIEVSFDAGGGMAERVLPVGMVVEFVLAIEGAEHLPARGNQAIEQDVFEGAIGAALGEQFVSQSVESREQFRRNIVGIETVPTSILVLGRRGVGVRHAFSP